MSSRHYLLCWRRILSAPDVIGESGEGETPRPRGKRQGGGATPFLQVLPHSYTKSGQMIAPGKPKNRLPEPLIRLKNL